MAWLREQNWTPIDISQISSLRMEKISPYNNLNSYDFLDLLSNITLKDKVIFFRQLATMISAGISITSSINILLQQTEKRKFKRILLKIAERINSGLPLSVALAEQQKYFGILATSLVKAGEESGMLDISLNRISGFLESQENLRKKIISALIYPIVVLVISLMVLSVMCFIVIPKFQKAFANLDIKMPWLTMKIFNFGVWLQLHWVIFMISLFALILLGYFLTKLAAIKYQIDFIKLKIPIFGNIIYKASISRAFKTMALLLKSGVPVLKAIELAGNVAGNEIVKKKFYLVRDAAGMGVTINAVMKEKRLFPAMVSYMVAVGEETGHTDEMLAKVAEWYETELEETVKRLSSILEPVLVVLVGFIVGVIVLAIFLPIISAIQELT